MFAAPQGRGEISGESRSFGIRGFAIRIPAINLEMPTIQLPSFVCFRREPEMRLESAYAPYVAGAPAVYGQLAPGGMAHVATPAPSVGAASVAIQPQGIPVQNRIRRFSAPMQPCQQPSSSYAQPSACPPQNLQQELENKERVIQELQSKLQRFQALEQSLNEISKQHHQLMREMQAQGTLPGCAPSTGKYNSAKSPIDAPAPSSPPHAPPATEGAAARLFKLFD